MIVYEILDLVPFLKKFKKKSETSEFETSEYRNFFAILSSSKRYTIRNEESTTRCRISYRREERNIGSCAVSPNPLHSRRIISEIFCLGREHEASNRSRNPSCFPSNIDTIWEFQNKTRISPGRGWIFHLMHENSHRNRWKSRNPLHFQAFRRIHLLQELEFHEIRTRMHEITKNEEKIVQRNWISCKDWSFKNIRREGNLFPRNFIFPHSLFDIQVAESVTGVFLYAEMVVSCWQRQPYFFREITESTSEHGRLFSCTCLGNGVLKWSVEKNLQNSRKTWLKTEKCGKKVALEAQMGKEVILQKHLSDCVLMF